MTNDEDIVTTINISKQLLKLIDISAEKNNRSRSGEIEFILRNSLHNSS